MGKKLKIVFMGTADFAVPSLECLIRSDRSPVLIVTQPDRPAGRGRQLHVSPIKEVATRHNLPLAQPQSPKKDMAFQQQLAELQADLFIVAAYGCLLPQAILEMPRLAAVNLHGSLLPAYRGAAPIQWSIIHGDATTGVTLMEMVQALDAGNMIDHVTTQIGADETYGELQKRLADLTPSLLENYLKKLEAGELPKSRPQDPQQVTLAPRLEAHHANIDWRQSAATVHNLIRGLNPKPLAYTTIDGQRLKVFTAKIAASGSKSAAGSEDLLAVAPGTIVHIGKEGIDVACATGYITIVKVIPANRGVMSAADFARSAKIKEGMRFVSIVAS